MPAASVDANTLPSRAAHPVVELSTESSGPNLVNPGPASIPTPLHYTDLSTSIIHRPPLFNNTPSDIEIYERIITPYNADAFATLMGDCNLSSNYPLLVENLSRGFPIGDMPVLTETIIIPNHPSVNDNLDAVRDYVKTELEADRMSGPFSQQETERILRGPFYCSPFIVATQDQGSGLPPKIRVCRNLSKDATNMPSVNSFMDKDDFPTRFDMPSRVADAVSFRLVFTQ